MILYKEYYHIEENKYIKFSISFNKDKINWATGQTKKIGYQVTVTPVKKGDMFESSEAFSGFNDCLLEIDRQSKKRLDAAIEILKTRKEKYLNYFNITPNS